MSKRKKSFPELKSWLPEVQKPLTNRLERFVRALAAGKGNGGLEPWASTVPVVLDGHPMLLTAKHAVDRLEGKDLFLEIPDRYFFPVSLDPHVRADSDDLDISVVALPMSSLDIGIDFLNLNVQHEPQLDEGEHEIFVAMGFPERETELKRSSATLELKVVNYWSFEASAAYEQHGIDRDDWVLTRFNRGKAYQNGFLRAMKKPHGMSGGALWRFWGPADELPTLGRVALAGVLVEYRESGANIMVSARLGPVRILAQGLSKSPAT